MLLQYLITDPPMGPEKTQSLLRNLKSVIMAQMLTKLIPNLKHLGQERENCYFSDLGEEKCSL